MDKKQIILKYSIKRFMESGYSSVVMDDISRGCGISKATLYSFFPSKEALILSCIDIIADDVSSGIEDVMNDPSLSTAEKFRRFFIPVAEKLSKVNAHALEDIQRNVPEAYEKIEKTRQKIIYANISKLIDEGKESGYILSDIDGRLVAHMLVGLASHIVDPDILSEFGQTPDRILYSVISIIIRGCLTEKGLKSLDDRE